MRLYIHKILDEASHPERGQRMCLGILTLGKKAGNERLIRACQRAAGFGNYSYKIIKKILRKRIEADPDHHNLELKMPEHENIRGADYYK